MKRKYLLFSLLLTGSSLYAQEWPAVHPETRPATRWWWLGSAVEYSLCCHPYVSGEKVHLIQNISCVRVTALL